RNQAALDTPELVNEDSYGDGWLVVVRADDAGELDRLMNAAAYSELVASLVEDEA
ncbi:MAG: hypothetical protein ACREQY_16285, partial [Candidatus Binatia bacterium]